MPRYIALVYQAGIANVFEMATLHTLQNPNSCPAARGAAHRLLQNAFDPCVWYCRGLAEAGCTIRTFSCSRAGDIIAQPWTAGLDDCPFRDHARVVEHG